MTCPRHYDDHDDLYDGLIFTDSCKPMVPEQFLQANYLQAEGDEATNTSVEEAPQDGEPAEAKEGEAVEDKVGDKVWVLKSK